MSVDKQSDQRQGMTDLVRRPLTPEYISSLY